MSTDTVTGGFTITPALTPAEHEELLVPHLDLVQEQDMTLIRPEGENGRCNAHHFETDLKALARQIGSDRLSGHVEVWGHSPGDVYRLGIVDGRVWAYYPQIIWPQG